MLRTEYSYFAIGLMGLVCIVIGVSLVILLVNRRTQTWTAGLLIAPIVFVALFGSFFAVRNRSLETMQRAEAKARLKRIGPAFHDYVVKTDEPLNVAQQAIPPSPSAEPAKAEVEPPVNESKASDELPKWINDPPQKRNDVYYVVVRSGEVSDAGMREEALDVKMVAAARRYIDELLYRESDVAEAVKIDASYLRECCIAAEYTSAENGSDETFVQLKFDKQFRNEVDRRYRQFISTGRVEQLGGITLGVLGVMAATLAFLRFTKPREEAVKRTG